MTTARTFSDSEGEFRRPEESVLPCRKCGAVQVTFEPWDSSDGAYTDYKYTCHTCGATWWVDGPDA